MFENNTEAICGVTVSSEKEEPQDYWTTSWQYIDPQRVNDYLSHMGTGMDRVITWLKYHQVQTVCDAGCGCGAYARKLAENGFLVSGFDISADAATFVDQMLTDCGLTHGMFAADDIRNIHVLRESEQSNGFDAVIARDVIDHMTFRDGTRALSELVRITRPEGYIIMTLDSTDDEYERTPHDINNDGDYIFTEGKWNGMVFHPYTKENMTKLIPKNTEIIELTDDEGIIAILQRKSSSGIKPDRR